MRMVWLAVSVAVMGAFAATAAIDDAAAQGWRRGHAGGPYVFWLFHPKVQVGPYSYTADWQCVASDGYTAYLSQASSKSRAQGRLHDIGFATAVCNLRR